MVISNYFMITENVFRKKQALSSFCICCTFITMSLLVFEIFVLFYYFKNIFWFTVVLITVSHGYKIPTSDPSPLYLAPSPKDPNPPPSFSVPPIQLCGAVPPLHCIWIFVAILVYLFFIITIFRFLGHTW